MTATLEKNEVYSDMDDYLDGPETAQQANAAYNERRRVDEEVSGKALEWARSLKIKSIKYMDGKVSCEFEHGLENFVAKTTVRSTGDVPGTFTEALNALAEHVADLLFIDPKERTLQSPYITIKGITMKHHDEGTTHVGIVFCLLLKNGRPLNANIPQIPLYNDDPQAVAVHTDKAAKAIENLIDVTYTLLSMTEKSGDLFAPRT